MELSILKKKQAQLFFIHVQSAMNQQFEEATALFSKEQLSDCR